ncbi:hypothetical protein [Streptomyces sp. NPDC005533]|uniref:hypothetical protein n=1 Tax=Streptomyces sp. NPDC005533 TaxID=3364723 RepID=UPI003680AB96
MYRQEKTPPGTRWVAARRSAAAAFSLAIVLGSASLGGAATNADIDVLPAPVDLTYYSRSTEPSTITEPLSTAELLTQKAFVKAVQLANVARSVGGLTHSLKVQNLTNQSSTGKTGTSKTGAASSAASSSSAGQNIYVFQRTRILFVLADMAAAGGSAVSGILADGGSGAVNEAKTRAWLNEIVPTNKLVVQNLARLGGMTEAQATSALKSLKQWDKSLGKDLKDLEAKNYSATQKSNGVPVADVLNTFGKHATDLNGDLATLVNGVDDIWGRWTGGVQTHLENDGKIDTNILNAIKQQAQMIPPNETQVVRNEDYTRSLIVWGLSTVTGAPITATSAVATPWGPIATAVNKVLGIVNIKGVSGWAGTGGFPTVDMYIVREDKHGAHMTSSPNATWTAYSDMIKQTDSGALTSLWAGVLGIGSYDWRDLTDKNDDVDRQTANTKAYQAMQTAGFDATAVDKFIKGAAAIGSQTYPQKYPNGFSRDHAAELLTKPYFRKLVWLAYNCGYYNNNPDQLTGVGQWAALIAIQNATGTVNSTNYISSLEAGAKKFLFGNGKPVLSASSMDRLKIEEAAASAAVFGVNFEDALDLLKDLDSVFDFSAAGGIWASSAPNTQTQAVADPVKIIAYILANSGNLQTAHIKIGDLAAYYGYKKGGTKPSYTKLINWWNGADVLPQQQIRDADNNDPDTFKHQGAGWKLQADSGAISNYMGGVYATEMNGNKVTISFYGTGIDVVGPLAPDSDTIGVTANFTVPAGKKTISTYAATRQDFQDIFSIRDLDANTLHTLTLTNKSVTGSAKPWFRLDAVRIWTAGPTIVGDTAPRRIRRATQPDYCLTVENGIWPTAHALGSSELVLNNYYCDGYSLNSAEEFTYQKDTGKLFVGDDKGGKFCLTNGEELVGAKDRPSVTKCNQPRGQQWRIMSDGTIHLFSDDPTPVDTGRCLDSKSDTPAGVTSMAIVPCDPKDPSELWETPTAEPVTVTGPKTIKLASSPDYCLTVEDGIWPSITLTAYSNLVLNNFYCDGTGNTSEEFTFNYLSDGTLYVGDTKGGDFCVSDGEATPATLVPFIYLSAVPLVRGCGHDGQQWRPYSDKTIHLYSNDTTPLDTGRCLASDSATPDGETGMSIVKCNPADSAQKWDLVPWVE